MDPTHPYEHLSLYTTGLVLGVWLVGFHIFLLAKASTAQALLKKFPRNVLAGQILLGIGLFWFWLLVADKRWGFLGGLEMDLGDQFNKAKWILRIVVPVTFILVAGQVREFLAVRALGLLGLMVAAPLLYAAFQKDPESRLLVPILAYALIIKSMFWVGMPYTFRDAVKWATASHSRWNLLCIGGLIYGLAVLGCAFAYWKGY